MSKVPVGSAVQFRNPDDTGLLMGGRVLAHIPESGEFEGGYLMVSHYVIRPEDVLTHVQRGLHPLQAAITRLREEGNNEHHIAQRFNVTLEELQLLAPLTK